MIGVSHLSAARPALAGRALSWAMAAGLAITGAGCIGGPDEQSVHRSEAEFNLAVGLMEEHNFAAAFQHLDEATHLDPDNAEAHLLLGNLYLFREDYPHAEEHLREALAANARIGTAGRPALNGEAQNSLGVVYIQSGRLPQAVEALRAATADLMYRTPHLAWGNLGWAYYEQHDYPQALQALQQSVQIQPLFCNGWYRMGQVDFAMGDNGSDAEGFSHAEDALTHALEVDAEECRALQDAWLLRGEARLRLGRHEDAVSDFEHCVELNQETPAGRQCQSLLAGAP
jgi:tetratricopeptide (TPR) repeat protein